MVCALMGGLLVEELSGGDMIVEESSGMEAVERINIFFAAILSNIRCS